MENNTDESKMVIEVSVRNLVEFIMRSGDIDNRQTSGATMDAMAKGTKIHKKIQKMGGNNYFPEVTLKMDFDFQDYKIKLEGRADGIIKDKNRVTVDEIKGVYKNVMRIEKPVEVHRAQAMCYAYMYLIQNNLDKITVRLTYCNLDDETIRYFEDDYTDAEIKEYFKNVIDIYIKWADYIKEQHKLRQKSIKELKFPFDYRNGQREIAVSVYKSIESKENLFIQAPTGVGKTISTVFPAVKAVGENLGNKIFYLTAKTITRTVANQAFGILRDSGLHFNTVTITAKEKICNNIVMTDEGVEEKVMECNPVKCMMAKGHFDRVNDAIFDIINNESGIDRDIVLKYAIKHNVCPFEMSLDISNFMDGIICDYNYVFDPRAKLKRYFSEGMKGEYIFLVDEAHNLVERAREMYSASLIKEDFLQCRKIMKEKDKRLYNSFGKCNGELLKLKNLSEEGKYTIFSETDELVKRLLRISGELDKYLDEHREFKDRDVILDTYFKIKSYLDTYELVDKNYQIYSEIDESGQYMVKLFCVNPSLNLSSCMKQGFSTIMFSATLLPVNYYKELLSGDMDDKAIYIDSPFDTAKRLLMAANDVSSRYKSRGRVEYGKILEHIEKAVGAAAGNYMVFFPSYKFMMDVYDMACEYEVDKKYRIITQKSGMNEEEKEEFLQNFENPDGDETVIGFCVLGGVFSEGIDLTNDRLIGSIIVGTGLPMVCNEREILKNYYDRNGRNGFDYAYKYPGINKVLQAAGRVIRTSEDYGIILLLDDRFMQTSYRKNFPREWSDIKNVNLENVLEEVNKFWKYV